MTAELKNRNVGIVSVRVADIEDAPWNFREHPEQQEAALDGAIDELGWYGYPDVYETPEGNYRLVDGHLRKALLIKKYGPDATIDVNVTDFDEKQAKKATLTKDPLAAMAESNGPALDALLREVETGSEALSAMLADLAEDAGVIPEMGGEESEPEIPDSRYQEQFGVIVICDSEASQQKTYEDLKAANYNVKVVTT